MTGTPLGKAVRGVVYVSDAGDAGDSYGQHSWQERPELCPVVTHRRGSIPSECVLTVRRDPAAQGPIFPARPGKALTDVIATGGEGQLLAPFGLPRHTFVKVVVPAGDAADDETTVFLGRVWKYRTVRRTGAMQVIALDYRAELRRIRCKGSRWRRPSAGDEVFIPDYGPHFNAGAQPDQRFSESQDERDAVFITPGYNQADGDVLDKTKDHAVFWRCGDALNCLRDMFSGSEFGSDPVESLDATASFLEWPEATADGDWGFLFGDPGKRVGDMDCAGRPIGWVIDQLVGGSGSADWYLSYRQDDKAQLEIYEQDNPDQGKQHRESLDMGELGSTDPEATDVIAHELEWDWTDAYAKVRAAGARKRYDVTLSTADSPTPLLPGWTADDETAWEDMPTATDAQLAAKNAAYPDVFCTWVVPSDFDWTHADLPVFGADGLHREGPRRCFAALSSVSSAEQEFNDQPVHLRMSVELSKDLGETWQKIPGQMQVTPLHNRVGFRLPTVARQAATYNREKGRVLTHNSGTAYDMRVTLSVEADERLVDVAERPSIDDWPPGEMYVPAGPRYRYEARRSAYLPSSGGESPEPLINSETITEFGADEVDVVQNDADELAALADRRLAQVARPRLRGLLLLKRIRPEWAPGGVVTEMLFGGDVGSISVDQAVGEVTWNFHEQTTELRLMGL